MKILNVTIATLLVFSLAHESFAAGPRSRSIQEEQMLAEQGDADAQCQLGLYYMNGIGVGRDEDEAVKWLEKAANKNHAQAQYNLGIYYAKFSDDEARSLAVRWLNEAVKQDYADAEYNLAKLYLNPYHPVSREQGAGRRAIALLYRAAAQGHAGAIAMLDELGCEVPRSQRK